MALSYAFLGAHYTCRHFGGACLCFCGVAIIVTSDVRDATKGDSSDEDNAWFGDLLCISGSFLYAVSNVVQERWVRCSGGPPSFLGRLGAWGFGVSVAQAAVFEREALFKQGSTGWNARGAGAWTGYTAALTCAYVITSWFLVDADAALFNLSLLTADIYAVIFAWLVQGHVVSLLYIPAFCCTMAGILVYHRAPKPTFSSGLSVLVAADSSEETEGNVFIINPVHDDEERAVQMGQ
eukprot:CAMPEP_0172606564 /NCGR_PEP_ID=MMETSP1068-20121228/26769_1 /TAXON_ID=35684 /ORGANISM="Pseudopedinella elastica, Strain CCMP716" /LENGTH=236 /DNA_ID=CAMNT_0013409315 /DNA_START=122 /DNA_END=832 /DNA_ORIENTATION=-